MVSPGHKPKLETETPNDCVSSLAQSQTTTSAKADLNNLYNFDALCRGCSFLVKEHNKTVLCDGCNKWYYFACSKISSYIFDRIHKTIGPVKQALQLKLLFK